MKKCQNRCSLYICIFIFFLFCNIFLQYYYSEKEPFVATTHSVSMPITNIYNCQNFCGPTGRCALTGQQCVADIDCPGCTPPRTYEENKNTPEIKGNNDAGKLSSGNGYAYSTLTTDIGTQSKLYTSKLNEEPLHPNFGVNTWITKYNQSMEDFNKRYRPFGLQFMPRYKNRYTLTGEFWTSGPIPANGYIDAD